MWPYTDSEWDYITHGKKDKMMVKRNKNRQFKTLIWASIAPSAVLIWILLQLI